MVEPQEIAEESSTTPSQMPAERVPLASESTIDVDGRSWVVVELEDHESWELYAGTSADKGSRLAHVTITDGGYFSTDRAGTVRGPYVTLSEATYPIGLDDPLLLGDVVEQAPAAAPAPVLRAEGPPDRALQVSGRADRDWVVEVLLLASAVGLVLLVQWMIAGRRRPRPTSA